jgi:hypothetical protein
MSQRSIFERNSLAISIKQPQLNARLRYLEDFSGLELVASKSGPLVPVLIREGGRYALHSLFDPEREAERMISACAGKGFHLCLGMGGGYHIRRLLSSPGISGVMVVDYSLELFCALISSIDLSDVLSDPRLCLAIDPRDGELAEILLERYIPFISGDFQSLPLRSRVDADLARFRAASDSAMACLSRISDDYTVQSHFGKIWFKNTIGNLARAEEAVKPLGREHKALVAAAGPSLEAQADEIAQRASAGAFLIATDTTLPFFNKKGLRPDAVVTLDCQLISYYHFMEGYPAGTPLVMDLSSPPLIAKLAAPIHFFSSGHPFCRYIASRWKSFPALDTSGGNVTHAALSLAMRLGASEVRLYGADFSYPRGKSYARGTYIYSYFSMRASRLAPVEGLFSDFLFRSPNLIRETDGLSFRYVTKPLASYREHVERLASALGGGFIPAKGEGSAIGVSANPAADRSREPIPLFAPGPCGEDHRSFLRRYARELGRLELPPGQTLEYIRSLDQEKRDLWMTIFPQAAAFSKTMPEEKRRGRELLMETRLWMLALLKDHR